MPRPFTKLLAMLLVALLAGCAHAPAAPPESYRSPEGFQDARWGMTPADLGHRLDGAELLDAHTYRTDEQVDGLPAQVTWSFPKGHLATVTVQYQPPATDAASYDARFNALAQRFGKPLPPPGSHDDADAALTVAAVIAAVLVIGIIIAIATQGHGHGGGGHAAHGSSGVHGAAAIVASVPPAGVVHPVHDACWLSFEALQAADASLELAAAATPPPGAPAPQQPPGGWMSEWRTSDTDVLLLGVELGSPRASLVVSYRSIALNPPLQR